MNYNMVDRKLYVNRAVSDQGVVGKTKTYYGERAIKLPYSVYKLLVDRKTSAQSEWIFPHPTDPAKPMKGERAVRQLKKILDVVGLPNIRFHDLRHTFATHAVSAGIDPKTLSSILGIRKRVSRLIDMDTLPPICKRVRPKQWDVSSTSLLERR